MNSIKMDRKALLEIVRTNKEKHEADFVETVADHAAAMIKIGEKNKKIALANLKLVKAGKHDKLASPSSYLPAPKSFAVEYGRAIRMLELSVEDVIDVEEDVFNQLVLDEWSWKNTFVGTQALYRSLI